MKTNILEGPRAGFVWLVLTAVLLNATASAQAPVAADAHVIAGSGNNSGGQNRLNLNVSGGPKSPASDVYLRLDLSRLPAGATAASTSKATLKLFVSQAATPGTFDVYRVTSAWQELAIIDSARPSLGAPVVTGIPVNQKDQYVLVDITAPVREWLSGTPNHGIALFPSSGTSLSISLDSKETTATSHDAELQIDYTDQVVVDSISAAADLISQEILDRQNADVSTLAQAGAYTNSQVTAEASARSSADATLASDLAAETTRAQAAEAAVGAGLSAETVARSSADTALQSVLTPLNERVRFFGDTTIVGVGALPSNADSRNTVIGHRAMLAGAGAANTVVGSNAMHSNVDGNHNVAVGWDALTAGTTGNSNVAIGRAALFHSGGSNNTALGDGAGEGHESGSNNLFLGATQVEANDSGTIRIGTPNVHSRSFIAGVLGTALSNPQLVAIDGSGQLGTTSAAALTGALEQQIDAESTRATAAEAALATSISDETARATSYQTQLVSPGTLNAAINPVDWTQLKNVPGGLADGVDDQADLALLDSRYARLAAANTFTLRQTLTTVDSITALFVHNRFSNSGAALTAVGATGLFARGTFGAAADFSTTPGQYLIVGRAFGEGLPPTSSQLEPVFSVNSSGDVQATSVVFPDGTRQTTAGGLVGGTSSEGCTRLGTLQICWGTKLADPVPARLDLRHFSFTFAAPFAAPPTVTNSINGDNSGFGFAVYSHTLDTTHYEADMFEVRARATSEAVYVGYIAIGQAAN